MASEPGPALAAWAGRGRAHSVSGAPSLTSVSHCAVLSPDTTDPASPGRSASNTLSLLWQRVANSWSPWCPVCPCDSECPSVADESVRGGVVTLASGPAPHTGHWLRHVRERDSEPCDHNKLSAIQPVQPQPHSHQVSHPASSQGKNGTYNLYRDLDTLDNSLKIYNYYCVRFTTVLVISIKSTCFSPLVFIHFNISMSFPHSEFPKTFALCLCKQQHP